MGKATIMGNFARAGALTGTLLLAAATGAGCAHSGPPPAELADARVAYSRAASGPAAQMSPARLRLAKQALDQAEMAYGAVSPDEVSSYGYVAIRKAEIAETDAAAQVATERRQKALRELATLSGTHADKARAELAGAEQRAATEQTRAVVAEQRVTEEQARAQGAEQRAETERQARLAAEARANEALTELGRMANVRREARGVVITLSGQVLFASDQATLLPASASALDNVVSALKAMPAGSGQVVIEGHTDSRGTRAHNRDLAQRRAQAVKDFLTSRGVPTDLFVVQGIGPDRPVADNRSPEGRANNRRVEIVLPNRAFANLPAAQSAPLGSGSPGIAAPATTTTTTTTTERRIDPLPPPQLPPSTGTPPRPATAPGTTPPRPTTTTPPMPPNPAAPPATPPPAPAPAPIPPP